MPATPSIRSPCNASRTEICERPVSTSLSPLLPTGSTYARRVLDPARLIVNVEARLSRTRSTSSESVDVFCDAVSDWYCRLPGEPMYAADASARARTTKPATSGRSSDRRPELASPAESDRTPPG